jgi:spore germination cell wall hydrolase CwlJ-like protein
MDEPIRRTGLRDIGPYVFGGIMLVAAFSFAGHQLGRNAVAHNAGPDIEVLATTQTEQIAKKGSLIAGDESFDSLGLRSLRRQTVQSDGKGDMALMDLGATLEVAPAVEPTAQDPKPVLKPHKKVAKLAMERKLKIEPTAVSLGDEEAQKKPALKKVALAAKPDDMFVVPKAERKKILAKRRVQLAEENCLARAVYFEARSESALGQMAVAKVILNRVRSPHYPNTICGVVYQGTHRRNSCQFSFACDGQPDDVRQPGAWAQAKSIAQRAIAGDMNIGRGMHSATSYHADYVRPKWSRTLRKVTKIGRHVFYSGI